MSKSTTNVHIKPLKWYNIFGYGCGDAGGCITVGLIWSYMTRYLQVHLAVNPGNHTSDLERLGCRKRPADGRHHGHCVRTLQTRKRQVPSLDPCLHPRAALRNHRLLPRSGSPGRRLGNGYRPVLSEDRQRGRLHHDEHRHGKFAGRYVHQ